MNVKADKKASLSHVRRGRSINMNVKADKKASLPRAPGTVEGTDKRVSQALYRRGVRFGKMQGYLEGSCHEMAIDAKYVERAVALLPKAAMIGTRSFHDSSGKLILGSAKAIVDALLYAVIVDESGLECPLVARELHRHKKQHAFKLVREVRLVTGLGGRTYPVLSRVAIEKLSLVPDEMEDIKAILEDPHYQGWIGPSPASIAAAITYLYLLQRRPVKSSQGAVSAAFGISEVCLRTRVKEIKVEATPSLVQKARDMMPEHGREENTNEPEANRA